MQRKMLDERFTDIADAISEGMGKWWVTGLSILAVALWLATGPFFHFSDTWQLIINTPTTILEMWIGFLLGAAANRTEKRNRLLHQQMFALEQRIIDLVAKEEQEIEQIERDLSKEGVIDEQKI